MAGLADLVPHYFEQIGQFFCGFSISFMYHGHLINPAQKFWLSNSDYYQK